MAYIQLRDVFSALRGSSQSASKFTARVKVRIFEASGRAEEVTSLLCGRLRGSWVMMLEVIRSSSGPEMKVVHAERLDVNAVVAEALMLPARVLVDHGWQEEVIKGFASLSLKKERCSLGELATRLLLAEEAFDHTQRGHESLVFVFKGVETELNEARICLVHIREILKMPKKGSRKDAGVVVPRPYYQKVDFDAWTYVRVYPTWDCDRGWTWEDWFKGYAQYYCTYLDCPMQNSRRGAITLHLWTEHEIDADRQHIRKGGIEKWKAKSVPTPTKSKYEMMERANIMA
ncbi:hypothetical protein R1sor_018260 [Riccia sorocarpa]|uniref:Uncharacterized protein n=1 Tax=Riccia sorocarpa TaxID=122646 RepID=A0ABD3I964_9MARC